jgi:hypothetical protein
MGFMWGWERPLVEVTLELRLSLHLLGLEYKYLLNCGGNHISSRDFLIQDI